MLSSDRNSLLSDRDILLSDGNILLSGKNILLADRNITVCSFWVMKVASPPLPVLLNISVLCSEKITSPKNSSKNTEMS